MCEREIENERGTRVERERERKRESKLCRMGESELFSVRGRENASEREEIEKENIEVLTLSC